jgi:hypothetical protein
MVVRAMLALGNSVHGLRPKHKQMLYCTCVLPITMYGSRLWLYEGATMKGPLDSLHKMQRHICLWITGAFKTSPMGGAETLAGMPPIHLHVKKLVEQSHIHTHALQASHTFRRLVDRDHKFSIKTLKGQIRGDLKSPITKAWLNLDFSSLDLDPVNRFNQPGLCPKDLYHRHIVYDIVSSPPKTDNDHNKFMANSMTTGLQPVLLRLTMLNCKQSQMASVRPTMLVWRMYVKYMSSPTPQTRSA